MDSRPPDALGPVKGVRAEWRFSRGLFQALRVTVWGCGQAWSLLRCCSPAPHRPRLAQFRARAGLREPPWGAAPALAFCHPVFNRFVRERGPSGPA